ncbi:MAG: hypothetical protein K6E76_04895 [Patescibacteria group bacterium]|nr:hypothetical protein [Patescibacteria group bacterium]
MAVGDIQSDFAKCGVSVEQLSLEAQAKYQAALDILNNPETPFYNITEDTTRCNNLLNQYSSLSTSSDGKTVEELQNMITSNTKLCSDMESTLSIFTIILNEKKLKPEDRAILENFKSRLLDAIQ